MINHYYKKYLKTFVLICLIILGAIIFIIINFFASRKDSQPVVLNEENTDINIAQYSERPIAYVPENKAFTGAKSETMSKPLVKGCSLEFSFVPEQKSVTVGAYIPYDITIRNRGTETCHNVSFSIYYADNEAFVSGTPNPTSSNYYWFVGDLVSSKIFMAKVITKETSLSEGSQISNEACATADNVKDVCSGNVVFVGAQASSSIISKTKDMLSNLISSFSNPSKESGVWVWQSPIQMTSEYATSMVSVAKENGFNAIYITIDDYLNIAAIPEGEDKKNQKENYMKLLYGIVSMANKSGIEIDVEGGAKDWAESENRYKGYTLIDFVSEYNKNYPDAKVRALQYDVEPYLLSQYDNNKSSTLYNYLEFIDHSVKRMQNVDAKFSVVIPHFYDSAQKWTPEISYAGKKQHPFTHLLEILERKSGSTLTIMAYRNFFEGDDGVEGISLPEIKETATGQYSTKVIIAQEAGNVTPSYVTFYGKSRADLFSGIKKIEESFGQYKSFGGVAVHYLDPFLQLE